MPQQYYKGVPIPPCPKVKVMVTRHKGRIGAGLIGGALFGPLGMAAGAMRGGRDESTWEEREASLSERTEWILAWKREFEASRGGDYDAEVRKKIVSFFKWVGIAIVALFILGVALGK